MLCPRSCMVSRTEQGTELISPNNQVCGLTTGQSCLSQRILICVSDGSESSSCPVVPWPRPRLCLAYRARKGWCPGSLAIASIKTSPHLESSHSLCFLSPWTWLQSRVEAVVIPSSAIRSKLPWQGHFHMGPACNVRILMEILSPRCYSGLEALPVQSVSFSLCIVSQSSKGCYTEGETEALSKPLTSPRLFSKSVAELGKGAGMLLDPKHWK